jgi:hypothetical protein
MARRNGCIRRLQQAASVPGDITVTEDGVAGDQNLGPSGHDIPDRIESDAAVDLNSKIQPSFLAHTNETAHFVERAPDELLPTKAGVDGHHKDKIDHIQHLGECLDRSGWVDNNTGLAAVIRNVLQSPVQVDASLLVYRNPVGPRISKLGNELIGLLNHEMHVENRLSSWTQGFHNRRTDRKVRDKMPVHYIQVDDRTSAFKCRLNIFGQMSEVGRKDRGCQFDQNSFLSNSGDC